MNDGTIPSVHDERLVRQADSSIAVTVITASAWKDGPLCQNRSFRWKRSHSCEI